MHDTGSKPTIVATGPTTDTGTRSVHQDDSVSSALLQAICQGIAQAGGWWPFDRFVQAALYEPDLGYYTSGRRIFGALPGSGSDFITAPEMSPLFGQALAAQVRQALAASGASEIWEFGAGSGALAQSLLQTLGNRVTRYNIVDVSGTLRSAQQARLAPWAGVVHWPQALPDAFHGVVIGNEVLDAVPFKRVHWDGAVWREQGVAVGADGALVMAVSHASVQAPVQGGAAPAWVPGTTTETHPQAHALVATVAERLAPGAMALWIDYGFPEAEYYHQQRSGGTMMCHRAHRADADALSDVGDKDITTHVNFTGVALAAQSAGADVMGYTSQARFLLNCGLADLMQNADLVGKNAAHRLMAEHEMGELFKVMALGRALTFEPLGFVAGDRTHRL